VTSRLASWLTTAALVGGCATTTRPPELAKAERAYAHAAQGDAGKLAPIDLEAAHLALDGAERAFAANDVGAARDMAYIAERRAQLAEARADEARDLQSFALQPTNAPEARP
jgi:hypothetical protein